MIPKLIYVACNAVAIAVALYKFSSMGITPVQPADWAGLFSTRIPIESNQVLLPTLN